FELIEIPELNFSPEKWYQLLIDNMAVSDDSGETKWRILRDGKFYKFISAKGKALKGHHWTEGWISVDTYYKILLNESFPTDKNDKNHYLRSIWDITQVSYDIKNPSYTIRNVRYADRFIIVKKNGNKWGYSFEELDYNSN